MKYYKRQDCRLCKCINLKKVVSLAPTPWADDYRKKENLEMPQEFIPLDILKCEDCGHAQLSHVIDANEVYLNYTYETASTLGLGGHFKESADTVFDLFKPDKDGIVVDIGSNDGILLKHFQDKGMKVLGVDPMPGIAEKATNNGIPTLGEFFNSETANKILNDNGPASIITSNNLVADTDDLTQFVEDVKIMMDKNSIFFFETFYLYLQIKNFVWDFTYHEHYSYFTIKPLIPYFNKLGLEIIDVEPNLTKGGSMRCTLQLIGGKNTVRDSVSKFVTLEEEMGLPNDEVFINYSNKINDSKKYFSQKISEIKKSDVKIAAYGASATSTTLLHHYEMGDYIDYLLDDFTVKQGLYSPGYKIPCFDPSKIYEDKPDYIIILAWRYYEKIISKHPKYLEQGGKFIIPLPEFKIISN
tara:strand:- start:2580 stop:3821 length:1242 start_codon:yes stop_codon:yes gene_type:complete